MTFLAQDAQLQKPIQCVRTIIEEDPWCTYGDIEAESSLSRGTIQRIRKFSKNPKIVSNLMVQKAPANANKL